MDHYDLIVFGGGNAISTAIDCGAKGLKVALIERGPLGGTCPHRGCIPSKLLIGYADAADAVRDAQRYGFKTSLEIRDPDSIPSQVFEFTRRYDGILERALGSNVTLYRSEARFLGNRSLAVNGASISADKVVLATGSRPQSAKLNVPCWTSDDVFRMTRLPRSITIVGGGYIACELGHFFQSVGVDTLLVVRDDQLLTREDHEIRKIFNESFSRRVPVMFNAELGEVKYDGKQYRIILKSRQNDRSERVSEALMYCTGRVPNTDQIGMENTDLRPNARGFVESDEYLRTTVDHVYSMGDVAGRYMFTHAANFESEYLGQQLSGAEPEPIDYGPMPHAIFAFPEIAGVGATEDELMKSGETYHTATVTYLDTTKGRAIKEEHGLCKIIVDDRGSILGCHIVGHQASVLVHTVLPVMRWRNSVRNLANLIYIHPSLAEVVRGAARKAAGMLPMSCREMPCE